MRPSAPFELPRVAATLVAALCVSLVFPADLMAESTASAKRSPLPATGATVRTERLSKAERTEHALSRLTFGPRPGEVQRVERGGIERWFAAQLHPETIDDSALEERLRAYPAMRLSQADLLRHFPSPAMLRMGEKGRLYEPADPVDRAIYADAEAVYAARKEAKGTDPAKDSVNQARVTSSAEAATQDSAASKQDGRRAMREELAASFDDSETQAVLRLAPETRFARLVGMPPDRMLAFRAGLRPMERLQLVEGLTPEQKESVEAMAGPARVVGTELLEARLLRDLYSERQLQAVMTDFWLNHFNIYDRKNQNEPYLLPAFEREVVRPHALGRFEDLLVATAHSPAMLMYLDNWESIGPNSVAAGRIDSVKARFPNAPLPKKLPQGINENYARELMELHTLGVNGGYTQADVIEVAKCLTGWTIDRPYQGGEFHFEPKRHEPGSKSVLGKTVAEGGEAEGRAVLHMLATSPATAHFIAQKIAVRFVSDAPPPSLVNAMAQTFLKKDGDIAEVLRTMFRSKEFWAPAVFKVKVKTPLEFVASAVRTSGATVEDDTALVGALNRLGMPLYGMQTPNGYSWKADEWVNSNALVARLNLALMFSANRLPGTHTDWGALLGSRSGGLGAGTDAALPAGKTAATLTLAEPRLETLLLGEAAGERTHSAVVNQVIGPAEAKGGTATSDASGGLRAGLLSGVSLRDVVGPVRPVRANAGKGRFDPMGGPRASDAAAPNSALDTMAGLLLGSPEFQRR